MSKRRSVQFKQSSNRADSMASNVFSIKDMQSQHNSLNGEFLLYQIILKRLLTEGLIDSSEKIKLLDYFNPDDETDQNLMKEFDETYKAKEAIYWYTRETCIYRLLNKALRTQNIAHLIGFTQFIRDLHDQLAYEQVSFFLTSTSKKIQVYRGQLISKDEVNRIKYAKGQLISMNSFLSTSTNRKKAIEFATSRKPPLDNLTTILLEITLDLQDWSLPYADIKNLSAFAEEEEILLMFGSVCRIDDIWEDQELKLWRVQLTLCSDKDSDLTEFEKVLENEIKGKNMLVCLGGYMVQMQNFDEAEKHYEMLLENELIQEEFDLATCYHGLAHVKEKKGEYDAAIENLNTALEYLLKNPKTKTHPMIAQCYNDLGGVYSYQENQPVAYQYYEKALKLPNNDHSVTYAGLSKLHIIMGNYQIALEFQNRALQKLSEDDSSRIANTMMEIGNIYTLMKKYPQALQTFEKTLRYQEKTLFAEHPDLGYTYIAMGMMFSEFNQEKKAFECINKALKLQLQSLPHDHPDFRETYKAFASLYKKRGDYPQSLHYLDRVLENQLKRLSLRHPVITETYSLIGNTHLTRKDYDQALVYFHKILESQIERLAVGNPSISKTLQMIADTHLLKKDLDQSLTYFHRLLDNELQRKLLEDPSLVGIYKSIANIYLEKQDFSQALIYFNRMIDIQLRIRPMDEKAIKETYTIIGDIYTKNCSIDQTLQYFSKIIEDLSDDNPELSKSFRNIEDTHFEKRHLDQVTIFFKQLLDNQGKELTPGDPQLSGIYHILGNIHLEKQNIPQALNFFNQLLNNQLVRTSSEGKLNDIFRILADMYFKVKNYEQSLIFFQKLLTNLLKENSSDYPMIVDVYQMIAINQLEQSQFLQAISSLNQLLDLQLQKNSLEEESVKKTLNIFGRVLLKNDLFPNKSSKNLLPKSFQLITLTEKNIKEQRHFNTVLNYFQQMVKDSSTKEDFSPNDPFEILGKIFLEQQNHDQSLIYFHQLQMNSPSPFTYKILAMIYYLKQTFNQSLVYLHELLNYHLESKLSEDPILADIYQLMAMIHSERSRDAQALTYFYRCLDCHMQEKPIQPRSLARIYALIAKIFLKNQRWKKIFPKDSDNSSSTNSSMNSSSYSFQLIQDIHFEKRHLDQCLNYFHTLLDNQLSKLKFGDSLITDTYQILAHIYLKDHRFDQAIFYFNKLLVNEFHRKSLEDFSLHYPYQMIGYLYFIQENYQRALLYLFRAVHCQLQRNSLEHSSIGDTYKIIGKVFAEKHLFYQPKGTDSASGKILTRQMVMEKFLLDVYQRIRNVAFENHFLEQPLLYFHNLLDQQTRKSSSSNGRRFRDYQLILANIYFQKSDYNRALFYLTQSFDRQTKNNPYGDAILADTYILIANVYFQKQEYQQALKDYKMALAIYKKIYPISDPKIVKFKQYVNEIYQPKHLE